MDSCVLFGRKLKSCLSQRDGARGSCFMDVGMARQESTAVQSGGSTPKQKLPSKCCLGQVAFLPSSHSHPGKPAPQQVVSKDDICVSPHNKRRACCVKFMLHLETGTLFFSALPSSAESTSMLANFLLRSLIPHPPLCTCFSASFKGTALGLG